MMTRLSLSTTEDRQSMRKKKCCFNMSATLTVLAVLFVLPVGTLAASTSKVLYKFKGGNDGGHPFAGLIFDAAGNLYGTTTEGGGAEMGTVFKLTSNSNGTWTESVLYRFAGGNDGEGPEASLIFDGAGNLYGTTAVGGGASCGACGTVFTLIPTQMERGGRACSTASATSRIAPTERSPLPA
jgi:uncharacterized repeat protein (TIGR03803 family)